MSSNGNQDTAELQNFLDTSQYTNKGVTRYEKIFGKYYVSTGGEETTAKFCAEMNLQPGQKILDIGCGTGGSAFYMAQHYGVDVFGVDLSTNMIDLAKGYWKMMNAAIKHRVRFMVEDATTMEYPENFYDVVYSRDTILHIADKLQLFKLFEKTLKPGGLLVITDYCCGEGPHSQAFKDYVKQRGYNLLTVKEYGKTIKTAGLEEVQAIDNSKYFLEILDKELKEFKLIKDEVVDEYSLDDYNYICDGWNDKLERVGKRGEQAWGYFKAKKMFA